MITAYFVESSKDYSDEFDVQGVEVISIDEYNQFQLFVERFEFDNEYEVGFGTNEGLFYESMDDVVDQFTFTAISAEEEKILRKFIPRHHGTGQSCIDTIYRILEDAEAETDDNGDYLILQND